MNISFAKCSKLNNIVGRSEYINDIERQETILLVSHDLHMQHSWKEHQLYEQINQKTNTKNNEGREVIFTFPDEFKNDSKKLYEACEEIGTKLFGNNIDYEYACHIKNNPTENGYNLNVHFIFSERPNVDLDSLTPKTYKKDIWQDNETHKLVKANTPNSTLVHKKGEIQKDKEGNIKYNSDIFAAKDTRFKSINFYKKETPEVFAEVMKKYGFDYEVYDYKKHGPSMPTWKRGMDQNKINEIKELQNDIRDQRFWAKYNITPSQVKENLEKVEKEKIVPKGVPTPSLPLSQSTSITKKEVKAEVNKPISEPTITPLEKSKTFPSNSFIDHNEKNKFIRDYSPVEQALNGMFIHSTDEGKEKYIEKTVNPTINKFVDSWKDKFNQLIGATYKTIQKIVNDILKNTSVGGGKGLEQAKLQESNINVPTNKKHGGEAL